MTTTETDARSGRTPRTHADTTAHHRGELRALALTGLVSLLVGALLALLGLWVDGAPAALGSAVGTAIGVLVLALGVLTVSVVAGVLPAASLMVALLTYALQLALLVVALSGLEGSGLLVDRLDRSWLGLSVIAVTLWWLAVQLRLFTTRRQPVFDLDEAGR